MEETLARWWGAKAPLTFGSLLLGFICMTLWLTLLGKILVKTKLERDERWENVGFAKLFYELLLHFLRSAGAVWTLGYAILGYTSHPETSSHFAFFIASLFILVLHQHKEINRLKSRIDDEEDDDEDE
jgi:hypothetical protein